MWRARCSFSTRSTLSGPQSLCGLLSEQTQARIRHSGENGLAKHAALVLMAGSTTYIGQDEAKGKNYPVNQSGLPGTWLAAGEGMGGAVGTGGRGRGRSDSSIQESRLLLSCRVGLWCRCRKLTEICPALWGALEKVETEKKLRIVQEVSPTLFAGLYLFLQTAVEAATCDSPPGSGTTLSSCSHWGFGLQRQRGLKESNKRLAGVLTGAACPHYSFFC